MLQMRTDRGDPVTHIPPRSLPRRMNMTKAINVLVPLAVALATTGLMFAATVA